MALTRLGNTCTATSDDQIVGSFTLTGIIFRATAANFVCDFHDEDSATPGAGTLKFSISEPTAQVTHYIDLSLTPIVFQQAINLNNLANGRVTIIFKETGR